ncbi:hypothetical protein [Pseudoalteromonas sp. MMG012]|uniref:hypothetical protein n=1 Tax=Pseudoalteromonas sp. MMG012 TaxID=2822686 RepID=UPI001B3A2FC7|nr:hypothetical protein [Pseudoalteromonas sp. MMG012]MBQ4850559.1 hypothetical protein [Pseudoalteromonas sp. MMG012]
MKLSNLILLSIASIAFFYIQLWEIHFVIPLYLIMLSVFIAIGIFTKNVNMTHISGFILALTSLSVVVYESGLVNYVTPEENPLLQSFLIYGTQIFFTVTIAIVLIFRVQLSRLLSNSRGIELTHFDGVFHWIFLYMAMINLLALLEDMAYILFDIKSWTLIYDNFEGLIYIAWAVCCGALLTMMICEAKLSRSDEANAS